MRCLACWTTGPEAMRNGIISGCLFPWVNLQSLRYILMSWVLTVGQSRKAIGKRKRMYSTVVPSVPCVLVWNTPRGPAFFPCTEKSLEPLTSKNIHEVLFEFSSTIVVSSEYLSLLIAGESSTVYFFSPQYLFTQGVLYSFAHVGLLSSILELKRILKENLVCPWQPHAGWSLVSTEQTTWHRSSKPCLSSYFFLSNRQKKSTLTALDFPLSAL